MAARKKPAPKAAAEKAAAEKVAAEKTPGVYTVVEPLRHDGQRYEPGETVELTDRQAAPLLGRVIRAAD